MSHSMIKYDKDHMNEISLNYKSCADSATTAGDNLEKIRKSFCVNYQGQAMDITMEFFDTMKDHIILLKDCFHQMESYVTYSKDSMEDLEQKNISEMGGK